MRILCLSDLHFTSFTYSPLQLFSKRITTNLNLLRRTVFDFSLQQKYLKLFSELNPDVILITGDLTNSTLSKELSLATSFINQLKSIVDKVFLVPGNHDIYTLLSRKRFYKTFQEKELELDRLKHISLNATWDLILLDTCYFFPHFFANGFFSKRLEDMLRLKLQNISKEKSIMITNHFPLEPYCYPQKHLIGYQRLHQLIQEFKQVKIYNSGHKHRSDIVNGSCTLLHNPALFHKKKGGFHIIDFRDDTFVIKSDSLSNITL